jgi:transposase
MEAMSRFDGVYLHKDYVDMRKSINGLTVIVESEMQLDLFARNLFVFCNRRRDLLKILYWDRTGFALWMKRLEKERFHWPKHCEDPLLKLTSEKLELLLQGYPFWQFTPHETLSYRRVS